METQIVPVPGVRWRRRKQDFRRKMDVWKMEKMFLLLSTLMCTGFSNSVVLSPTAGHFKRRWGGILKYTQSDPTSVSQCGGDLKTPESPAMEKKETKLSSIRDTLSTTLMFLAYLVPEDQSALRQVRGEEREANLWCLQLQQKQTTVRKQHSHIYFALSKNLNTGFPLYLESFSRIFHKTFSVMCQFSSVYIPVLWRCVVFYRL